MKKNLFSGLYVTALLLLAVALVSVPITQLSVPNLPPLPPALPPVAAHSPGVPTLSEYGTPTVDGVIQPGEYNSCYSWNVNTPKFITFCEKNDQTNDYYAFQFAMTYPFNPGTEMAILFDNNHDGSTACSPNFAEDAIGMTVSSTTNGPARFLDMSYCGLPANNALPFPLQASSWLTSDDTHGGTIDGTGMETYSTSTSAYTFELSHPLNSMDANGHDYSLSPGSKVGWCAIFWNADQSQIGDMPTDCWTSHGLGYGDILKLGGPQTGVCDLAINKDLSPNPLMSPGTATVTLTITNPGGASCGSPGAQVTTTVLDNLPTGLLAYLPVTVSSPYSWNCPVTNGGATVTCTTTDIIASPSTTTITFGVNVNITPPSGQITNCASVANSLDTVAANNNSCVTRNVSGVKTTCDLAMNKTISQSVLQSPGTATITLTVTNPGGASCVSPFAVQTQVTDVLPPGLKTNTLVSAPSGWSCPDPIGSTTVQCTTTNIMTYPLVPPVTISFGVDVNVQGNTLTNCANVSNQLDTNPANNESCVTIKSNPSSAASVCAIKFNDINGNGVQDSTEPQLSGWSIHINGGTSTAHVATTLTTSSSAPVCVSVLAPGSYTVSELPLVAGWTPTAPSSGSYSVTVSPGQQLNLSFGNEQSVVNGCDLQLNKTMTVSPNGTQVTITLTVTNVGNMTCNVDAPVKVTDTMPTGLVAVSAGGVGWTCNLSVTCIDLLSFPPGASSTITIIANATGPATVQNCSQLIFPPDTNPANNNSCDNATVVPEFPPGAALLIMIVGLTSSLLLIRRRRGTR